MRNDASVLPLLAAATGVGILSAMDGLIKHLTAGFDIPQVVAMRYGFGAVWALIGFLALRTAWPGAASFRANGLRALITVMTAYLFFHAISVLPLAEAIALAFTAPLMMAAFGRLLLGEPVTRAVVLAIGLASGGVLVILQSKLGHGTVDSRAIGGILAALASAVTYALAMVLVRKQTAVDPVATIVLLQNLLGALIAAPIALVAGVKGLDQDDLLVLLAAGFLGSAGHYFMTWGYGRAHAARLGIMEYTAFVWAALIGFVAFGEVPTVWTVAGAVLIIGACLLATRPAAIAAGPEAAT